MLVKIYHSYNQEIEEIMSIANKVINAYEAVQMDFLEFIAFLCIFVGGVYIACLIGYAADADWAIRVFQQNIIVNNVKAILMAYSMWSFILFVITLIMDDGKDPEEVFEKDSSESTIKK